MTTVFGMALLDLFRKYQGEPEADALREALRWLAQELMELEVSHKVGAERYQRKEGRLTYRNGYRRRRAEKALVIAIQEAYVEGVSTREMDDLVEQRRLRAL